MKLSVREKSKSTSNLWFELTNIMYVSLKAKETVHSLWILWNAFSLLICHALHSPSRSSLSLYFWSDFTHWLAGRWYWYSCRWWWIGSTVASSIHCWSFLPWYFFQFIQRVHEEMKRNRKLWDLAYCLVIEGGMLRDDLLHFSELTGNSCVSLKGDSHYL